MSPIIVQQSIAVTDGARLAIDPGVTVRLCDATAITVVQGELIAQGTADQQIQFTSATSTGHWGYIGFGPSSRDALFDLSGNRTSGCVIAEAVVENGGGVNMRGAISIDTSAPLIRGCTIRRNLHGGIFASMSPNLRIQSCAIYSNQASKIDAMTTHVGAGIYLWNSPFCVIEDCEIAANICTDNAAGGIALSANCNNSTIRRSFIHDNRAEDGDAGGIGVFSSANVSILACTISNNVAVRTYDGGGIYTHNSPDLSLRDCRIVNNDAVTGDGGGVYLDYKSIRLTMSNCELIGNRAAKGGALFFADTADKAILSNRIESPTWIQNNGVTNEIYNGNSFQFSSEPHGAGNIDARNVAWGTNQIGIAERVFDFFDDSSKGIVTYAPNLLQYQNQPSRIIDCDVSNQDVSVRCSDTIENAIFTLQSTPDLFVPSWSNTVSTVATTSVCSFAVHTTTNASQMYFRVLSGPWKQEN